MKIFQRVNADCIRLRFSKTGGWSPESRLPCILWMNNGMIDDIFVHEIKRMIRSVAECD